MALRNPGPNLPTTPTQAGAHARVCTQHVHESRLDTAGTHCYIPYETGYEPAKL